MLVKNLTEYSVQYMGYSFFTGAVHMWQRAKSQHNLLLLYMYTVQKKETHNPLLFFKMHILRFTR
jgi:hypothetical protein